jgi:aminopeptidase N
LTVKQLQDTSDGTPIYEIPATVDIISGGTHTLIKIRLSKPEETFAIERASSPAAVLLDPNHDFLREIPKLNWSKGELGHILALAMNAVDRQEAMLRILDDPTEQNIRLVVAALVSDNKAFPAFRQLDKLAKLAKPELRDFWLSELQHSDFDRRAQAVNALGLLPQDAPTTARIRSLVNDQSPISVVLNAIRVLKAWDGKANEDIFKAATAIKDRRGRIKRAAESALAG